MFLLLYLWSYDINALLCEHVCVWTILSDFFIEDRTCWCHINILDLLEKPKVSSDVDLLTAEIFSSGKYQILYSSLSPIFFLLKYFTDAYDIFIHKSNMNNMSNLFFRFVFHCLSWIGFIWSMSTNKFLFDWINIYLLV